MSKPNLSLAQNPGEANPIQSIIGLRKTRHYQNYDAVIDRVEAADLKLHSLPLYTAKEELSAKQGEAIKAVQTQVRDFAETLDYILKQKEAAAKAGKTYTGPDITARANRRTHPRPPRYLIQTETVEKDGSTISGINYRSIEQEKSHEVRKVVRKLAANNNTGFDSTDLVNLFLHQKPEIVIATCRMVEPAFQIELPEGSGAQKPLVKIIDLKTFDAGTPVKNMAVVLNVL